MCVRLPLIIMKYIMRLRYLNFCCKMHIIPCSINSLFHTFINQMLLSQTIKMGYSRPKNQINTKCYFKELNIIMFNLNFMVTKEYLNILISYDSILLLQIFIINKYDTNITPFFNNFTCFLLSDMQI